MHVKKIRQYAGLKILLTKNLPKTINGSNEKHTANNRENRNKDSLEALESCKFIHFNTSYRVSMMIFDIDEINGKKAIEVYTLDEMLVEIMFKTNKYPTYILQTDKGFHFAFHLKNHVYLHQPKAKKYLLDIKRAITNTLQCDDKASHRAYGIWRNPLKHKFWFTGEYDYELSDFKHLVKFEKKTEFNNNQENSKAGSLIVKLSDIVIGNRNNSLFKFAVNFCNDRLNITYDQLYSYITNLNSDYAQPALKDDEIAAIVKSVYDRKSKGTLYRPNRVRGENIDYGVMEFTKMAGLSYENYLKETKQRQRLSAKRTNNLSSYEAKQEAMKHARKYKLEKNRVLILNSLKKAIEYLKQENRKLTFVAISKQSKLDRRTVKKYVDDYDLLGK